MMPRNKLCLAIGFGIAWFVCLVIGATLVGLANNDVVYGSGYFSDDLTAYIIGGIFSFFSLIFLVTDIFYWVTFMTKHPGPIAPTHAQYPTTVPLQPYQPVPTQSYAGYPTYHPFCSTCGRAKNPTMPCLVCEVPYK